MINTFSTDGNLSKLDRKNFQKQVEGKNTDLYILRNQNGMEVAVTNFGCALLSIMVPDKNGKYANVLLGHDSIDHMGQSTGGVKMQINELKKYRISRIYKFGSGKMASD